MMAGGGGWGPRAAEGARGVRYGGLYVEKLIEVRGTSVQLLVDEPDVIPASISSARSTSAARKSGRALTLADTSILRKTLLVCHSARQGVHYRRRWHP